jgi:hypothetical protein
MRAHRICRALVPAVVIAGAVLVAGQGTGALAASSTAAARWRVVATRSENLTSLVALSARAQWVFGGQELPNKPTPPVVLRHSGSRWIQAALPAPADGTVVCAGATSAADVWAFDGQQFGPGYAPGAAALQLRSGRWAVRHSFGDFFLTGCNVVSATDVWAFGSTGAGPAIGTWHLHGSTWTHLTSYPAEFLGQASVVSRNNIWATGWDGIEGVLAHWDGTTWKADPSVLKALPRPSGTVEVQVGSVTAISSSDLWVEALVGREGAGGVWHYGPVAEHWNGASWKRAAASSFGYYLPVAVPDGQGGWWSAGYPATGSPRSMTYLLHGTRGHWVKVGLPRARKGYDLEVREIAAVPGGRTAYAAADEVSAATGHSFGVILKVSY